MLRNGKYNCSILRYSIRSLRVYFYLTLDLNIFYIYRKPTNLTLFYIKNYENGYNIEKTTTLYVNFILINKGFWKNKKK